MNLIKYINQPFPKAESKWIFIIPISLFVFLFLNIFQPFGLSYVENNKFLILSGYGLVTFLILVIDLIFIEKILPNTFKEESWTIGKEFIWLLWIIFSIGMGNALYTFFVFDFFTFNLRFLIIFELFTLFIGIIPITIVIVSTQNNLLKKHLNSANDLNSSLNKGKISIPKAHLISFYADNEKDSVEFDVNNFYFIESSGNYIELYLLDEGKIIRQTFRNTLKRSLEFFMNSPEIIQCHRAFIVNTNKIISAKGNSQGLRLSLENCNNEVPVSRNYVDLIRNSQLIINKFCNTN